MCDVSVLCIIAAPVCVSGALRIFSFMCISGFGFGIKFGFGFGFGIKFGFGFVPPLLSIIFNSMLDVSSFMDKYLKIGKIGEGAHGIIVKYEIRKNAQLPHRLAEELALTLPHEHENELSNGHSDLQKNEVEENGEEPPKKRLCVSATATATASGPHYVAIKKIKVRDARLGLSMEAIRELKLLQEVRSPHVMPLYEVFVHKATIHLVMRLLSYDLEALVRDRSIILAAAHVKCLLKQALQAVAACHRQWIMHRDLKPGNFLLSEENTLVLSDFGLAKMFGSPDRNHSPQACTLWYRAPELLFGSHHYNAACDMWSMGCIFSELMWRKPLFVAERESDLAQLQVIFAVMGTPNDEQWPNYRYMQNYIDFEPRPGRPLSELFPAASDDAIDLLSQMLQLNPQNRISAVDALSHRYFTTAPLPSSPNDIPRIVR